MRRAILIEGETGTGKGTLAGWIHSASARASQSFVDLNCAGLPRDLLESEFFGHEKGAFTGAVTAKPGLVEAAHRGTMFLDEVGDTDLAIQPKLLKIVEEKRFRRLGDVGERRVDVRLVAASNKSLAALVEEGKSREDLYYRSTRSVLRLPTRDREDIPSLVQQLLPQLAREIRRPVPVIDTDAIDALVAHSWPGSIRELRNVLERAILVAASPILRREDLRLNVAGPKGLVCAERRDAQGSGVAPHPACSRKKRKRRAGGEAPRHSAQLAVSEAQAPRPTGPVPGLTAPGPSAARRGRRWVSESAMSRGIASSVATCIAPPRAIASAGIPNTTHDRSASAIVTAPACRNVTIPSAPSEPMPVRSSATIGTPRRVAAD